MIAALFVAKGGVYCGLTTVEPWTEEEDARDYHGPHVVVAHPPCSVWCQLARVNEARYGHKAGDDGGCFKSALDSVRMWGGVLEHPAETLAWKAHGLQRPRSGSWQRVDAEETPIGLPQWVTEVCQGAYGHRAVKRTWLLSVGREPEELDWSRPTPTATISFMTNHGGGNLPRLSKKEAKATPQAFRDLLLSIARDARPSFMARGPGGR